MSGRTLGKQILNFRLLTKRRIYIGIGVIMLAWFGLRAIAETAYGGFSLYDAYAFGGLLLAITLIFTGLRIPPDD